MVDKEALQIKKLLEGCYPALRESIESDLAYVTMLSEYDFKIMWQAAKNYIKRSRYTPTIADLIQEYENIVKIISRKENDYLLSYALKMEELGLLKPGSYTKPSEYDLIEIGIMEGTLSKEQKDKIIAFSKNDPTVIRLLSKQNQLQISN